LSESDALDALMLLRDSSLSRQPNKIYDVDIVIMNVV